MESKKETKKTRIAAVGDIHVGENSKGEFNEFFAEISSKADILLLCGDLTKRGLPSEVEVLATELLACRIPVLAVLGNHDVESGQQAEIVKILSDKRVNMLDGDSYTLNNVGFAGVKGFGGGFLNHALSAWGEEVIKKFVYETVNEELKLENALKELETEHKVAILHYAPISDTVTNEHPEIFPFLGSSRLLEPVHRYNVSYVFHGHAHLGPHEGKSSKGTKVFNVSYPLLKKMNPKQPYALIEL